MIPAANLHLHPNVEKDGHVDLHKVRDLFRRGASEALRLERIQRYFETPLESVVDELMLQAMLSTPSLNCYF
jgi:hypothetical protein